MVTNEIARAITQVGFSGNDQTIPDAIILLAENIRQQGITQEVLTEIIEEGFSELSSAIRILAKAIKEHEVTQ